MTKSRSELNGEPLTERQKQMIRLTAMDLNIKQISEELNISTKTVEYHRKKVMKKIGVSTSIGILRWALKNGYATL